MGFVGPLEVKGSENPRKRGGGASLGANGGGDGNRAAVEVGCWVTGGDGTRAAYEVGCWVTGGGDGTRAAYERSGRRGDKGRSGRTGAMPEGAS
jgi:hypothetical protein